MMPSRFGASVARMQAITDDDSLTMKNVDFGALPLAL